VRELICQPLDFLGFSVENNLNIINNLHIESAASKPILIIPADEEAMIAQLCQTEFT